jgi:hypothetical protein
LDLALSELTKKQIEKILTAYCSEKLSLYLHEEMQLGFRFRGDSVTLYEVRPAFTKPGIWAKSAVAQFRFNHNSKKWTLYWPDRNSKWHEYEVIESSRKFETLLKEVQEDPTGIFWS